MFKFLKKKNKRQEKAIGDIMNDQINEIIEYVEHNKEKNNGNNDKSNKW